MRQLPNGILIAPKRGRPPEIPEGYERYHGDPFIFAPKLSRCLHREIKQPESRCCNQATSMRCSLFGKRVSRFICMRCDDSTG